MFMLDHIQAAAAVGMLCFGASCFTKKAAIQCDKARLEPTVQFVGINMSLAVFLVCASFRQGAPGIASPVSLIYLLIAGVPLIRILIAYYHSLKNKNAN